ncbi:MAG: tetratricopeptide repeat protein, partial [Candidatus Lokiarchaeota archaeon]|nr:tetratricopeptide repeat protein [Candidatus Lokiarchaeota archaeon]
MGLDEDSRWNEIIHLINEKDLDSALKSINNQEIHFLFKLVSLYKGEEDYFNLNKIINRVILINPDLKDFWLLKGETLEKLKKPEDAKLCYLRVLKINPGDDIALRRLSILEKKKQKKYKEEKPKQNLRKEFKSWFRQGNILRKKKKYKEAINCYDEELKKRPDNLGALINKGNSLLLLGRKEEAINLYDAVHNYDATMGNKWMRRALELIDRGILEGNSENIENKIDWIDEPAQLQSDEVKSDKINRLFKIVNNLLRKGKSRDALIILNKITKLNPDLIGAW